MSINWTAKTFNASNAEFLGKAADLAYENKTTIAKTARTWKMELVKTFKVKETQAYIIRDYATIILAFRGTEITKARDILTDINAKLVNGYGGKVHQGFSQALNYVWDEVWNTLKVERGSRSL